MDGVDESVELIAKIFQNKISRKQVELEINRIESKYGKASFPSFQFEKKEKPWDQAYYQELKTLALSGAGSKEFIMHLVEVRDSLNLWNTAKKIFFVVAIIMIIIIAVIVIL